MEGGNHMSNLNEIRANLRTAITFSKRPGNEGQCLANSKGVYRPVSEVLSPAIGLADAVETFINELEGVLAATNADNVKMLPSTIRNEIETFKASLEPKLNAANAAKAAAARR